MPAYKEDLISTRRIMPTGTETPDAYFLNRDPIKILTLEKFYG